MKGNTAYALAMKKVKGLASGFDHAVRTGDNTFSIFFIDGSKVDLTIPLPQDGLSITGLEQVDDNHFRCVLSDGTKTNAIEMPVAEDAEKIAYTNAEMADVDNVKTALDYLLSVSGASELQESLTATTPIGSVTSGMVFPKGTSLEEILRKILIKIEAPTVTLALVPNTTVYDIVTETLANVTLKATVTKKTYGLKTVKFYDGTTLLDTQTISASGSYTFTYVPTTPIKETTTFKAVVEDVEGNSSESKITVSFVGKSYYGIVEPTVGEPTEAQIKALNGKLKIVKGYVYENITADYNKVVYAYPASFGALASIKDVPNNINYTASFARTTVMVDGIQYYCYTQIDPSGADGVELTFA